MDPIIRVRDLFFQYDEGTPALRGVNFELYAGETVALLGANGSGKTTFALHLNGLLTGEGYIEICGVPLEKRSLTEIRRRIGFVFQDADEQLFMPTVLEDVAFGLQNAGHSVEGAHAKAAALLERVGMRHAAHRAPYHLSAGEKRRVALAGVLAMEPDILVLDEPTTYLDPPGWRDLATLLQTVPQAKLLITHDTAFARLLASRAVFFQQGRIVAEGAVSQILTDFQWDTRL